MKTKGIVLCLIYLFCYFFTIQAQITNNEVPAPYEKKLATATIGVNAGGVREITSYGIKKTTDETKTLLIGDFYDELNKAFPRYKIENPKGGWRNIQYVLKRGSTRCIVSNCSETYTDYYYSVTGEFWSPDPNLMLSLSISKALENIREGSRFAIDQICVDNNFDKEDVKDQIVEQLLDEGYKVVAKDYLEKLYEEQQAQQSGIYNENTTVQENNFSAVGYYISVKQSETVAKVQVINVSTGEYEAKVIIPIPSTLKEDYIKQVSNKALQNIREGSRLAIDQVRVTTTDNNAKGINKEDFQDLLIGLLLNKGYKVVAKEYMERLYEEQQSQQSGIYNDNTTIQENNFSAIGYYLKVKLAENSIKMQVINVSTGEYEGNATVNF